MTVIATGAVDLSSTSVGACPYAATCRYPLAGPFAIGGAGHHLSMQITNVINSGAGNRIGLYTSPSNTAVDVNVDGSSDALIVGDYPLTDTSVNFYYWGPAFCCFTYGIFGSAAPGEAVCAYGTQVKPGTPSLIALTPSLLLAILSIFTRGWREAIAAFFAGRLLDSASLCATAPPSPSPVTATDILNLVSIGDPAAHIAAVNKCWQTVEAAAWQSFCECIPGSPVPISPAPPLVTPGPDPT